MNIEEILYNYIKHNLTTYTIVASKKALNTKVFLKLLIPNLIMKIY